MCGIAGFVRRRPDDAGELERMLGRLVHRGPDGAGAWRATTPAGWHVALGHRRLSVIDPAGGAQPMRNADGTLHITYNGEVYNFADLRDTLRRDGHTFRTRSDTEVILNHFERHGVSGLVALNGMFAFAVWEDAAGRLTLARDRVGIKPLYFAPLPCGGLAFASELTALLACDGVDATLSRRGLASYFYRDYVEPPYTIVRGAFKLQPGHSMSWQDGVLSEPRPFWTLADVEPPAAGAMAANGSDLDATLTRELADRVDAAVRAQLVADVPLGVFLSGGIDSSLVAAAARRTVGDSLMTFSIGFDDAAFDESAYARRVADHLGTRHVERRFSEHEILDVMDDALASLDEPMADPSLLPTYLLSRVAREHVTVALGGDGGDELWAGYPTCRAHRMARRYAAIPRLVRRRLIEPLVHALPVGRGYQPLDWKLKRFAGRWEDEPVCRHQEWMSNLPRAGIKQALDIDAPPWVADPALPPAACGDVVNTILALDFQTYLPGSVLTKVDRASMAHGLEVRPPLLHNELIDFAFALPSHYKLRGRTSKWLLKAVAAPLLPPEIVHRPKKGFGVPLAAWVATALDARVRDVLRCSPLWDTGLLNRSAFVEWHDRHLRRQADESRVLWSLLVLDHFCRRTG